MVDNKLPNMKQQAKDLGIYLLSYRIFSALEAFLFHKELRLHRSVNKQKHKLAPGRKEWVTSVVLKHSGGLIDEIISFPN